MIGYALIGCGGIAAQHLDAIAATPGARLVAVASRSAASAQRVGEAHGVPWYTDVAAMLQRPDLDVVILCTPSGLHAEQALLALQHGKHVVVEKPLALTLESADELLAEAQRCGLQVAVISQRRFEPVIEALRGVLESGALGQLVLLEGAVHYHRTQAYYESADWRGTIAMDGGALMNQAIHMVDLLRWLGGPVSSVAGQIATLTHQMEAEDVATASLRFQSGALGTITATTSAYPGFDQQLRIYGERGFIELHGQRVAGWSVPGHPAPAEAAAEGSGASNPLAISAAGHARQYADITAALQEGRPSAITGRDGRETLALVLAVYESARTGRAVTPGGGEVA